MRLITKLRVSQFDRMGNDLLEKKDKRCLLKKRMPVIFKAPMQIPESISIFSVSSCNEDNDCSPLVPSFVLNVTSIQVISVEFWTSLPR